MREGETDLIEMEILTGDETPRRVPARRMPLVVRQGIQTAEEDAGGQHHPAIQQSVGHSHCNGVEERRLPPILHRLSAVECSDQARHLPLPRVDDLLDQLGESRFFTTLDLASGFWQIRVAPGSREKTAFVVPHGLFEFRVMPFGLSNAPAVFQRLMQRVLMCLNPEEGQSVYIDDILVYSRTLKEHLCHLRRVLERIQSAGLKLKISKCVFIRKEVEYLGHILTPGGLKTNPKLAQSLADFPIPKSVKEVRQFLGLCSYYRRFIHQFASISQPLNMLTRKNVTPAWTEDCQKSFSILGLGAVLSQLQQDGFCHPVAYTSRSLAAAERNFGITELETLAIVWAMSHFCSYLYSQDITVYTDHSAVKAILNAPSPTGKHARWWT